MAELFAEGQIVTPVSLKKIVVEHWNGDCGYVIKLINAAVSHQEFLTAVNQWWWTWYLDYLQSDAWKLRRRKVLERCDRLCEGCREEQITEVHHRTYAHVGDELLFELVGLCDACHAKAHQR
jgi:hypothetical protein